MIGPRKLAIRSADQWDAIDAGGGFIIGLELADGADPESDAWVSLWTNGPLEKAIATLTGRGVEVDGPVVVDGIVQMAFLRDPDGNRLSLTNVPPSPTSVLSGSQGDERPLFEHLGLRWTAVSSESVTAEVDIRDDLRGPAGMLQGGVIAALVDVAAAAAAAQSAGGLVATREMTLHFLAPGRVGPVRAVGELLRSRSGGAAVEVRVYDTGRSDRLMTVALVGFTDLAGASRMPSDNFGGQPHPA